MPTFQSIAIHPSVRSRLLRSHKQDDNVDSSGNNCQESGPQRQQQKQPARSGVSIPRSLLTRDTSDLVDMFSMGDIKNEQQRAGILVQIEKIRCQVAHKMISKTRNGKRLLHIDQQQEQQYSAIQKKRRPLIPGGSINALDAWNSQRENRRKDQDNSLVFSTGCLHLDNLIAFPMEYFFEPSDNRDEAIPSNVDLVAGEAKGLPRGYVLKISGTSGKTQLAIQLVSQVMIQSFRQLEGKSKRIRYCFSTAGHSGYSLAQRLFEHIDNNIDKNEEEILKEGTKKIEFQPIATISQLISTVAKLEEEWLQHTASNSLKSPRDYDDKASHCPTDARQGTVSMLVLDALPLMVAEKEDTTRIQSFERWLKRLARNYSMLVVVVTATGGGGSSSIFNAMSPDIHLQLQKRTPTTSSIHLMRHPAKPVTEKDHITYTPPKYNV